MNHDQLEPRSWPHSAGNPDAGGDDEPDLKLYVVGETSGNPEDWSPWKAERLIVAARSAAQALKLAQYRTRDAVALLQPTQPGVVIRDRWINF